MHNNKIVYLFSILFVAVVCFVAGLSLQSVKTIFIAETPEETRDACEAFRLELESTMPPRPHQFNALSRLLKYDVRLNERGCELRLVVETNSESMTNYWNAVLGEDITVEEYPDFIHRSDIYQKVDLIYRQSVLRILAVLSFNASMPKDMAVRYKYQHESVALPIFTGLVLLDDLKKGV